MSSRNKKVPAKQEQKVGVTVAELFKLIDGLHKKAKHDPPTRKLLETAAREWERGQSII
jgi:hypothetical protein